MDAVGVKGECQVQLPERAAEVPGSSVAKIGIEEIAAQRPHVLDEAPGFLNVRTLTVTQREIRGVGRRGLEEECSHESRALYRPRETPTGCCGAAESPPRSRRACEYDAAGASGGSIPRGTRAARGQSSSHPPGRSDRARWSRSPPSRRCPCTRPARPLDAARPRPPSASLPPATKRC